MEANPSGRDKLLSDGFVAFIVLSFGVVFVLTVAGNGASIVVVVVFLCAFLDGGVS